MYILLCCLNAFLSNRLLFAICCIDYYWFCTVIAFNYRKDMSKLYNIFFRYISHTYMYYIYVTKWLLFVNCVYVNITNCICSKNGKGPFLVLAIRNVKILIIKWFISAPISLENCLQFKNKYNHVLNVLVHIHSVPLVIQAIW